MYVICCEHRVWFHHICIYTRNIYWLWIQAKIIYTSENYLEKLYYSKVPLIRPSMVLVESGLNSEQTSVMRTIYIEKLNFGTEASGQNSMGDLNFE